MKKSQLSKTVRMLKAEQILSTLSQCVNKYGPAQKMYLFPVLWIFHKNLFTLIEFFISYDAIYTHKELFCNQSTMKILNIYKINCRLQCTEKRPRRSVQNKSASGG